MLACGLLLLLLLTATPPTSKAEEPASRPIVAGFERFHLEPSTDLASGGRLLMGELNCTSCHRGDDAPLAPVARKQAPILDKVGARIKLDHLRAYLADPRSVKPGTTMPNLLAGLPKAEVEADVDALVHFLATTGKVTESSTNRKLVVQGKTLYEQVGCAACHGVPGEKSLSLATSSPIGDVSGKYTYNSLIAFVQDPLATRPSGRMPSLNLKPAEAQAIASFLLKDANIDIPPNVSYRYYEGDWDGVPDFDALTPVSTGVTPGFDVEVARRHGDYALRFEGTINVDRPGSYAFHLASDDGSKVFVDDKLVTDNDGVHPKQRKTGRVPLTRGRHKVVVGYFQGGGEEELDVEFEGPGLSRRPLASEILPIDGAAPPPAPNAPTRFVVDPEKAAKGRLLFSSIGCASCHQLREDEKAVEPRPASKPLDQLQADRGCLAAEPPPGVPDYDLSPRQRAALTLAIRPTEVKPPSEKEVIARTLVAFNCYACHVRDGIGGVEEGRDSAFATTQKEMGDEGRIPPLLTGVGGKLTEAWLKHVLADGAKDRPYMLTRMPKFGREQRRPPHETPGNGRRGRAGAGAALRRPRASGQGDRPVHRRLSGVQLRELPPVQGVPGRRHPGARHDLDDQVGSVATGSTDTSSTRRPSDPEPGCRPPGRTGSRNSTRSTMATRSSRSSRSGFTSPMAPTPPSLTEWAASRSRSSPTRGRSSTGTSSKGPAPGRSAWAIPRRRTSPSTPTISGSP